MRQPRRNEPLNPLRTIVVPLDGSITSEQSLEPAHALARRAGAGIRLLTVLPVTRWTARVDEAARYLEKRAADEGLDPCERSVIADRPTADVIVAAAAEAGTLVCMGTHGRGAVLERLLGSTAAAVVRDAGAPVLLVGPRCGCVPSAPGGHLLIGVEETARAADVIEPASELARALGLDTAVVHAGSSDRVLGYARELPATVVAVAARSRRDGAHASERVVERILHDSPCPVLVVPRPEPDGEGA